MWHIMLWGLLAIPCAIEWQAREKEEKSLLTPVPTELGAPCAQCEESRAKERELSARKREITREKSATRAHSAERQCATGTCSPTQACLDPGASTTPNRDRLSVPRLGCGRRGGRRVLLRFSACGPRGG
jgi:hypothetical protein